MLEWLTPPQFASHKFCVISAQVTLKDILKIVSATTSQHLKKSVKSEEESSECVY